MMKNLETPGKTGRVGRYVYCNGPLNFYFVHQILPCPHELNFSCDCKKKNKNKQKFNNKN